MSQTHKFTIGQKVSLFARPLRYAPRASARLPLAADFRIARLLPETGGDPQYRIKDEANGQERVVIESEIDPS